MDYPFGHYGTACACLVRLAQRKGKALTELELLERFRPQFELWKEYPGVTDTAMVCDLARQLGLAGCVQVVRRYELMLHCADHPKVSGILVFTEKFYVPGGYLVPRYDCSVAERFTAGHFQLWTPRLEQPPLVRDYNRLDWDLMLAYGLVLA